MTSTDLSLINKIVTRASAIYTRVKGEQMGRVEQRWLAMDLLAVHQNTPLRLQELADADDVNLVHDVFGIERHLNRETKQLENCFVPRFAVQ